MTDAHLENLTRSEAAKLCGMSSRHFGDVIRPHLPERAAKGRGAAIRFDAASVVDALVWYRIEQAAKGGRR